MDRASTWTPRESVRRECARRGERAVVDGCVDLLAGRTADPDLIVALGGPPARWAKTGEASGPAYWLKVWAARVCSGTGTRPLPRPSCRPLTMKRGEYGRWHSRWWRVTGFVTGPPPLRNSRRIGLLASVLPPRGPARGWTRLAQSDLRERPTMPAPSARSRLPSVSRRRAGRHPGGRCRASACCCSFTLSHRVAPGRPSTPRRRRPCRR